jgi:hypothetical protein
MLYQFEITTHGVAPEIQFLIKFGNSIIKNFECNNQTHFIEYTMSDHEDDIACERLFQITMQGKNQTHTVVSDDGSLKSDCYAILDKIVFDEIDVTTEFTNGQKIYLHNNNGNGNLIMDEFYGFIGCNGSIDFAFSTPLDIWMFKQCL